MVRALAVGSRPTAAFRDDACATLRLSRARGKSECDALGVVFEEDISDDRRSLILDLLASAGTPEAQIVMRRLLSLEIARKNGRTFASFVQRLGFMERPDGATLRFLISVYAESKSGPVELRSACAYALGAGAGRAHVWGLTEAATRASDVLRRDLLLAQDAADKCALVTALGNAGLESDVGIILRFIDDPTPRVRGAAALALRKMHTNDARGSLLALLTSSDQNVAESALSALFEQSLEPHEIVRLAELVLAGRTPLAVDGRVLRLIAAQKLGLAKTTPKSETVEEAVQLLLTRIESNAVRGSSGYLRRFDEDEKRKEAHRAEPPVSEPVPVTVNLESRVVEAVPPAEESREEIRTVSAAFIPSPITPRAIVR
jgi:hypothetical protein